jgi:cation diffusion facilitator family transporter
MSGAHTHSGATFGTDGGHDHVFLSERHDDNARRTLLVVWLTAAMMVVEIAAGYWTGSMALLADGFHKATHAGALGVAAAAYAFARKNATNARFSFGTGEVGDLAGFASALILGVIALGIAVESLLRFFSPAKVAFDQAIWIAALGLLVNVVSALALGHGHDHGRDHGRDHGHDDHRHATHDHQDHHHAHVATDNNLRAAYVHVIADAFTSVLAIVALLAGKYAGWAWLDPAMGVVGAIVIGRWSWLLMRDTALVLLDASDDHVAAEVRELVEGPGDAQITDLHVWRVGPDAHAAIVSVSGDLDVRTIRERLIPVHELRHVTVEAV